MNTGLCQEGLEEPKEIEKVKETEGAKDTGGAKVAEGAKERKEPNHPTPQLLNYPTNQLKSPGID